ncbi:MAG: preprotein translocase subunit SecG [Treponema sp.]|nr:preprotein translocase subunit SecG [Treponema sp.]
MNAIRIILFVAFGIACFLLILLVLFQDDGQSGMGGLLGGRGTAAFGSHSASILTKTTFVLVVLFFAFTLSLSLLNKKPRLQQNLAPAGQTQESPEQTQPGNWWQSSETATESDAQD